ncbi:neurotransmitter-gated ion-channel ligand binding domain-containing protein [Ditylenchus destructor]|nr:neurotransmitter-gated ion-channel ligand binding domain-containing protein [Ditylenchus destructor]
MLTSRNSFILTSTYILVTSCLNLVLGRILSHKGFEAQLYEDLLYDYNKIPRPVKNSSDVLMVDVGSSLIRLIDVDEKNQILTTNLWLEMRWTDAKLQWDPNKYGGIKTLHIPSTDIWVDSLIVLIAAGDPDITIFTDALVSHDGRVFWQPPAIYKSFCSIDVSWFPYDLQNCNMKFGAWSYTGFYVDLRQLPHENVIMTKDSDGSDIQFMENGMDLSFFYKSAEWDLLSLTSARHSVLYASCCGPEKYVDITYYFVLRRKTLFFTCNLIIPCFLISFLTTFVFYLSDHKITFSISILVTLTVFFLVLIDIMPPTSLVIPMFGRYLVTTMILGSGAAHQMSPWIRSIFLTCLPKILLMKRPEKQAKPTLEKRSNYTTGALFTDFSSLASLAPSIVRPYGFSPATIRGNCTQFGRTVCDLNGRSTVNTKSAKKMKEELRKNYHSNSNPLNIDASFGNSTDSLPSYFRYPTPCGSNTQLDSKIQEEEEEYEFSQKFEGAKGGDGLSSFHNGPNKRKSDVSDVPVSTFKTMLDSKFGLPPYCPSIPETGTQNTNSLPHSRRTQFSSSGKKSSEIGDKVKLEARKAKNKVNDIIFANLLRQVRFIAEHFRSNEEESEISDDWTFVAMVLDRLFLIIFSILNMATFSILLDAPSLYDRREPLNVTVPSKPLGQANLFSIYN